MNMEKSVDNKWINQDFDDFLFKKEQKQTKENSTIQMQNYQTMLTQASKNQNHLLAFQDNNGKRIRGGPKSSIFVKVNCRKYYKKDNEALYESMKAERQKVKKRKFRKRYQQKVKNQKDQWLSSISLDPQRDYLSIRYCNYKKIMTYIDTRLKEEWEALENRKKLSNKLESIISKCDQFEPDKLKMRQSQSIDSDMPQMKTQDKSFPTNSREFSAVFQGQESSSIKIGDKSIQSETTQHAQSSSYMVQLNKRWVNQLRKNMNNIQVKLSNILGINSLTSQFFLFFLKS